MNHLKQRALGVKLAKAGGGKWQGTQAHIENEGSCFEDILKTAALEGGVDALVPQILQGPPEWAFQTLRYVPNLGRHRDALLQKVAEDPEWALHALCSVEDVGSHRDNLLKKSANPAAAQLEPISGINLTNQGLYICRWTLLWMNNGALMPVNFYPPNQWTWSPQLIITHSSGRINLADFAKPNAPLVAGNEVMMYIAVASGNPMQSPPFRYDPNNQITAQFTCIGRLSDPILQYTGNSNAQ